jgi:hypothetical protein
MRQVRASADGIVNRWSSETNKSGLQRYVSGAARSVPPISAHTRLLAELSKEIRAQTQPVMVARGIIDTRIPNWTWRRWSRDFPR